MRRVWCPPVDLSHPPETQQEAAKTMLQEDCEAFAYNSDNIGCIPSLKTHINFNNTSPVQKINMFIPKPLHQEGKEYLQDLLNKGWITPSKCQEYRTCWPHFVGA